MCCVCDVFECDECVTFVGCVCIVVHVMCCCCICVAGVLRACCLLCICCCVWVVHWCLCCDIVYMFVYLPIYSVYGVCCCAGWSLFVYVFGICE